MIFPGYTGTGLGRKSSIRRSIFRNKSLGTANNQLAAPRHGVELLRRGVLYAPDYVINAGGVINISHEGPAYDKQAAVDHVGRIHDTLREIFGRAEAAGIPTSEAADRLAEERFTKVPEAA